MPQYERRHGKRPDPHSEAPPVDAGGDGATAWASTVGSQGMQRIASSAAGRRVPVGQESIVPALGVVARQPADDVLEMPEETITAGGAGGGDSGVIEMPEETITAGGGGGGDTDVIEMPEETITAGEGGGDSDVIEMPEETITAGGESEQPELE